ncbi:MAG TPA: hypothetical protein VM327_03160 [Candidatus Thermoplasmatota archaeon]|nr:hypothetical protein [Candidatus Thermoplasmatota archaeon]
MSARAESLSSVSAVDVAALAGFEPNSYTWSEFRATAPLPEGTVAKWAQRMERMGIIAVEQGDPRLVSFVQPAFIAACGQVMRFTGGKPPPLWGSTSLAVLSSLPCAAYPPSWAMAGMHRASYRRSLKHLESSGIVRFGRDASGRLSPRLAQVVGNPWISLAKAFADVIATPPKGESGKSIHCRESEAAWVTTSPWSRHPHLREIGRADGRRIYYRGVRRLNALDIELLRQLAALATGTQTSPAKVAAAFSLEFLLDERVRLWFDAYGLAPLHAQSLDWHLGATGFPGASRRGRLSSAKTLDFGLPDYRDAESPYLPARFPPTRRNSRATRSAAKRLGNERRAAQDT